MINDMTTLQLLVGIARMLVSIGWMYALMMVRRLGNRLSDAALDRRNYADLIHSLAWDGRLQDPQSFLEAAQLWSRYRTRRLAPNGGDSARMKQLAAILVPPPGN